MMGFGLAGLLTVGTVWVASTWIQALKRGKPDGYHLLRLRLLLHEVKLHASPFIRYSGVWDIRRSETCVARRRSPGVEAQASS